jgi:predicted hydrocarbon binding protein
MVLADIARSLAILAGTVFLVSTGLLVLVRFKSRATLITDILLRSSLPLALVVFLSAFAVDDASMSSVQLYAWIAVQAIMLVTGVFVFLVPALFLHRTLENLDGFVIISRGLLEGMHKRLDSMYGPGPARLITYAVGKEAGKNDSASAISGGLLKGPALWKWLPFIFRLTGYGKLRYTSFEPGREVRLTVVGSFEVFDLPADGDGHVHNGCDLTRGYLAGIGKAVHPTLECQAEETRCAQVHGGTTCEFRIKWFEPVKAPEA